MFIRAIKKSNCFHKHGHHADCHVGNNPFMVTFAIIQIILSQVPNFQKLAPLSIIAAIMSFMYCTIGIGLSISKLIREGMAKTSLTGIPVGKDFTGEEKMWKMFLALGDVAVAFSFSFVLLEIQVKHFMWKWVALCRLWSSIVNKFCYIYGNCFRKTCIEYSYINTA